MSLFQIIMSNLLLLCTSYRNPVPITLPILPAKFLTWETLTPELQNPVSLMSNVDPMNPAFSGRQTVYMNKKACCN